MTFEESLIKLEMEAKDAFVSHEIGSFERHWATGIYHCLEEIKNAGLTSRSIAREVLKEYVNAFGEEQLFNLFDQWLSEKEK